VFHECAPEAQPTRAPTTAKLQWTVRDDEKCPISQRSSA